MNTKYTLINAKKIIGLKVISLEKGNIIEDVDEVVYDPHDNKIKAFVIDPGGWFADAKIILFEDIKSLGEDAIIIESEAVIKKASGVTKRIARIVKDNVFLNSEKVITEDGTGLGRINDILFDAQSGKVLEFDVSQGALSNIRSGIKRIKVDDIIKVGEDVTIVKGFVEGEFEKQAQNQGLQGAASTAREKTPDLINKTKEKLTEFGQTAREKAEELTSQTKEKIEDIRKSPKTQKGIENVKDQVAKIKEKTGEKAEELKETTLKKTKEGQDKLKETTKKSTLGKYLTVNLLTPRDKILAHRGDLITNHLLNEVEKAGLLNQVLLNNSNEPVEEKNSSSKSSENAEVNIKINKNEKKPKTIRR